MSTDSKETILLVDDDSRSARLLARMLREDGFDVELAFDGAAAIARLSREPVPNILLTDLRIPHADGLAVAQYARSRRPAMPVVFVTNYPELVRREAEAQGMLVHCKPVDYQRLNLDIEGMTSAAQ